MALALHLLLGVLNFILNCYGTNEAILKEVELTTRSDEFECVDIYKQPAFSHTKLKNHKIQVKPTFIEDLKIHEDPLIKPSKLGSKGLECSVGKVPIQKVIQYRNESFHRLTKALPGQHFAVVRNVQNKIIRGVEGRLTVRELKLQHFQVSGAQIWIQNGPQSQLNSMQARWEVNPILYGDSQTRITIFWTADNYRKTGCYNTACPDFVVVYKRPVLGTILWEDPGTNPQILYTTIKKDKVSGNWWFLANDNIPIGYWPKELFSYLREEGTFIQYGGWTVNVPNATSPPMGSGEFASKYVDHSAHIFMMGLIDEGYKEVLPNVLVMKPYTDDNACYTVDYNGFSVMTGYAMSYGGPGGSCSNGNNEKK